MCAHMIYIGIHTTLTSHMKSNRPKFYRDPIHGQIRYKRVNLSSSASDFRAKAKGKATDELLSWSVRQLIDCPEFQRLRHIRQNGLANLVFHGAEHSRFSHSMGVCYLAQEMYDSIVRNMGETPNLDDKLATTVAALLHDIGHGPFSHTMEEILKELKIEFNHEKLTLRIIEEETEVHKILTKIDPSFPKEIIPFIDKSERNSNKQRWQYRLVSSQLDADRLDYLMRDAKFAGVQGHGFDLARLLDMLCHYNGESIAVDRHAIEAVEAYILMLEQMYRAVYFHPSIRGATVLLRSVLKRAIKLYINGDRNIFLDGLSGKENPLKSLINLDGNKVPIEQYIRLGEYHVWSLIEDWQNSNDKILADLSSRLMKRIIFKTIEPRGDLIDLNGEPGKQNRRRINELVINSLSHLDLNNELVDEYYVCIDKSSRNSYKRYNFKPDERAIESIWMVSYGDQTPPCPIEEEESNTMIVSALKQKATSFSITRLILPHEVKAEAMEILGQ